jgi:hypothetical protein
MLYGVYILVSSKWLDNYSVRQKTTGHKMTIGQIILWILLGLVVLVLLIFIYGQIKNRITRQKQLRIFSDTFDNKSFPLPTIVFGYQYWWPTFKVTFDSFTTYQIALQQGLLTKFEEQIGAIYGEDFEPKRAITYVYPDNKQADA